VRGHLLLEVLVGLAILLGVFLVVATLFPTSYDVSLQSARLSAGTGLARQILEAQKQRMLVDAQACAALGNQTVSSNLMVQGRPVQAEYFYRLDEAGSSPQLWRVTLQWRHSDKVKEVVLVGVGRSQ